MAAVHHDKRLGFTAVSEVQYHLLFVRHRFELFNNGITGRKDALYSVFNNIGAKPNVNQLTTGQSSTPLRNLAASSGGVGLI